MIDFEKIGKRILEERKYLHRISQEKMAEDLGMYQADISNLEKAKNGSGITDLAKLDMIADYFDMPLETLLFGRRQDKMEKYYGNRMRLKESKKKMTKRHESILRKLMGLSQDVGVKTAMDAVDSFECGPYMIYVGNEHQNEFSAGSEEPFGIEKPHIYVIYQDEVIGSMTAAVTSIMEHVFRPIFEKLKYFIMPDIFDINDTLHLLNPYLLLQQYAMISEEEELYRLMSAQRMKDLNDADAIIFYVENAYVREDCRRNGIFRMMIDVLKKLGDSPLIWLSLEPTSGKELDSQYSYHAIYEASELGQINMNGSIAERLGFTIDMKTVDRQTERLEEDGTVVVETVPVRRTAYFLPKTIKNLLKDDKDALSQARARKQTFDIKDDQPEIVDIFQGAWKKYGYIMSVKVVFPDETAYAYARGMDWKSRWLGVSKDNPAPTGEFVDNMEKYDRLKDAENSRYYKGLKMAEQLLGAIFFGTVDLGDLQLTIPR